MEAQTTPPDTPRDFSKCWRLIKSCFSRKCDGAYKHRAFCVENSEQDLTRHVEYIHHNPVRHGLVSAPTDWEYSGFHRYVCEGMYDAALDGYCPDCSPNQSIGILRSFYKCWRETDEKWNYQHLNIFAIS